VTLPERLALLIKHLPEDAAVTLPVSWLRSELEAEGVNGSTAAIADLTVEALAAELGRSTSTVRGWLGAGAIPEAYKLGREWRIPRAAVRRFLDSLSNGGGHAEAVNEGESAVRGHVAGAWRRHLRRTRT
jgi:excisionase family DNA binding protein